MTGKVIRRIIKFFFQKMPLESALSGLAYLLENFHPTILTILSANFFQAAYDHLAGKGGAAALWGYAAAMTGYYIVYTVLYSLSSICINAGVYEKSMRLLKDDLVETSSGLPLIQYEDEGMLSCRKRAEECVENDRIPGIFMLTIVLSTSVAGVLSLLIALGTYHPLLSVVAVASVAQFFLSDWMLEKEGYRVEASLTQKKRMRDYIWNLFTDFGSVREMRVMGFDGHLAERWKRERDAVNEEEWRLDRKKCRFHLLCDCVKTFGYLTGVLFAVLLLRRGTLSVGVFGACLVAFASVQTAVGNFFSSVGKIPGFAGLATDYFAFVSAGREPGGCGADSRWVPPGSADSESAASRPSAASPALAEVPASAVVPASAADLAPAAETRTGKSAGRQKGWGKEREKKRQAFQGRIETIALKNVSFRYPRSQSLAVKSASLTIHRGEVVSLVGVNGSGKTTLVKLLLGIYSPEQGEVCYNGRNLEELDKESLYRHVALLSQDFALYPLSLEENIALADIGRAEERERIQEALERVHMEVLSQEAEKQAHTEGQTREAEEQAHMERLSWEAEERVHKEGQFRKAEKRVHAKKLSRERSGFGEIMGKEFGGPEFSGGQKQRLALARVLFADRELIILDEPTSALDPLQENEILEEFLRLAQGRTTVIISHRVGLCRHVDRIAVMRDGSIAEWGSHEELMAAEGEYAKLYHAQSKWYTD